MNEAQKLIDKYGYDDAYFACVNSYYEIEKIETQTFLDSL